MRTETLEADYLVVGTGCMGMGFTDTLIHNSDKTVVMVDRNANPGGHWNYAYPFVELHGPACFYGVESTPLSKNSIDATGLNAGLQERATGPEIVGYFRRVMDHVFMPTGRVKHFPSCNYLGEGRFVSKVSGQEYEVGPSTTIVDATYLENPVPANTPPPFEVGEGVRCVPVGELVGLEEAPDGFTVIGAGKTGSDACIYLLSQGVDPADIRWVKPQESVLWCRESFQGGDRISTFMLGYSKCVEAAAKAASLEDFLLRCEAAKYVVRVDPSVPTTMFRGGTVSAPELTELRRIKNVVRLGRVQRIEPDKITLEAGMVPTSPGTLHVHCAASALTTKPAVVPVFADRAITLQEVQGPTPFSGGIQGFVEALGGTLEEKNALCPPTRQASTIIDLARMITLAARRAAAWGTNPQVSAWTQQTRLSFAGGMVDHMDEPKMQEAMGRFAENLETAIENSTRFIAEAESAS